MKKKLLIGIGVCILLIVAGGLFLYAQLRHIPILLYLGLIPGIVIQKEQIAIQLL